MAQSFTCPSCGAPLDYTGNGASTIPCPYCYTSVIVPQELRSQPAEPVAAHVATSLAGRAHQLRELPISSEPNNAIRLSAFTSRCTRLTSRRRRDLWINCWPGARS